MIDYYIENLSKKIKEAKETNNLEREKNLKGFSRLLSICENIYKIVDDYEDCEEFEEIRKFYSWLVQILCKYIEDYVKGENISSERLKTILNCIKYKYAFYGGGRDEKGNSFLSLCKCVVEDDYEFLNIPTPITKTDEWYSDLMNINDLKK